MSAAGLIELEAVLAVARHRSFRAAAIELGLSRSAVSHAVAALEARLGVRLFNRTTRSVALTEAGADFVAGVGPALADIRTAIARAGDQRDKPAGTLRLNMAAGAARQIMTPVILEYLRRYPDMAIDLVSEEKLIDIVAAGFDAGVRLQEYVAQDMIAVPLGPALRFAVVGSPAYFHDHPAPLVPGDLVHHRCIRTRLPSGAIYRWEFERHGEELTFDGTGPLILNDATLMLEAVCAGVGITYLAEWTVAADIAAGRLIRVLEDWTPPFPGLCLYYPSRRHVPAGLRALVELIREVNRCWPGEETA